MNEHRILVMDCMYIGYQAQYAMRGLRSSQKEIAAESVPIVFAFLSRILSLGLQFKTNRFVFCWDSISSLRREIVFPQYKANRSKNKTEEEIQDKADTRRQLKILRQEVLPEIGFYNSFLFKGYEADDLICNVCLDTLDEDVVVIAADEDLFQLIENGVSIYNPTKHKMMDLTTFKNEYKIHPRQWALVKAIAGCATDNVPGVGGVGEPTAIQYLNGQLKEGSAKLTKIKSTEASQVIDRNLQLVKLPFPNTPKIVLDKDDLRLDCFVEICKRFGFVSFMDKKRMDEWARFLSADFRNPADSSDDRVRRAAYKDEEYPTLF